MEKKVPERKVSLREEDIFYVYDKRINKCIKEDCEGTVKYGLVLRVNMTDEETCNCFECNKCHMKYTPYPNYVRLTKTDMLTIYNKEEVEARDRKRAEDAIKQAAREKRKQQGRKFTPRRDTEQGTNGRSYERKPFERRSYEKKPYEKKSYEKKPYEKKSYEKKSYENRSYENKSYEKKSYDNKPYDFLSYDGRPYERKSYDRKPYENDRNTYDRKPYDRNGFDKKPYEGKTYEKKNYEGRSYSPRNNEGRPYGERAQGAKYRNNTGFTSSGYKKPYRSESSYQKNHQ